MSISSTGLYGSATIVNTDIFDDVQAWKEQVTTLSTFFLTTKYVYIYTLPHSSSLLPSLSRVRSLSPPLSLSSPLSLSFPLPLPLYLFFTHQVRQDGKGNAEPVCASQRRAPLLHIPGLLNSTKSTKMRVRVCTSYAHCVCVRVCTSIAHFRIFLLVKINQFKLWEG
jgi:hypothetical protein